MLKRAFRKAGSGERREDIFEKTGYQGVTEARDSARLQNFSPFLGAIMDRYYRKSNEAPKTVLSGNI